MEILIEARNGPLSRLQRVALANRLSDTLQRLRRAGRAHPALEDMATAVDRDLAVARLTPEPPWALGVPAASATALQAGLGPIAHSGRDPDLRAPKPPGLSLEL